MSGLDAQGGIVLHVLAAMGLGALLGLERELAGKPAGLRTHMLVAGAAALLVAMGDVVIESIDREVDVRVASDPMRIIEAVITGVSFLGAGTIIRRSGEDEVEGLTTAASILVTAGIGVAVALGQWIVAVALTVIVLLTLRAAHLVVTRTVHQTARAGGRTR
jgi:putative Mg2+ transporter-C (MgtC) family protein